MSVFKTYDVRGVWGQGIDLAFAYRLGRALPRQRKAVRGSSGTTPASIHPSCTAPLPPVSLTKG